MRVWDLSAMVVYTDTIKAETKEEAIDIFRKDCPYDIDCNTISCEESDEESEEEW